MILRALAVVDDAIKRCQYGGPLRGSEPGFRLALAFLYAVARERDYIDQQPRAVFDELWNAVTGVTAFDDRNGQRSTWARTQLAIIERRVNVGAIALDRGVAPPDDPDLLRRYTRLMRDPDPRG